MSETPEQLLALLRVHEGFSPEPYPDGGGHSVGYGHHIEAHGQRLADFLPSITRERAEDLLHNDAAVAWAAAEKLVGTAWDRLIMARRIVVADMAYNLGIQGLAKFKRFLAAVRAGDWSDAASEMEESRWYKQVGNRGQRLKAMMFFGTIPYGGKPNETADSGTGERVENQDQNQVPRPETVVEVDKNQMEVSIMNSRTVWIGIAKIAIAIVGGILVSMGIVDKPPDVSLDPSQTQIANIASTILWMVLGWFGFNGASDITSRLAVKKLEDRLKVLEK